MEVDVSDLRLDPIELRAAAALWVEKKYGLKVTGSDVTFVNAENQVVAVEAHVVVPRPKGMKT
jgi:hypothetical protein